MDAKQKFKTFFCKSNFSDPTKQKYKKSIIGKKKKKKKGQLVKTLTVKF